MTMHYFPRGARPWRYASLPRFVLEFGACFLLGLFLLSIPPDRLRAQSAAQAPETSLSQATELMKAKDYAGAEKAYRQALLAAPDDPEILKALGVVCQKQLKFKESVDAFQQILTRAPLYPGVNGLMGISYYALNEFDKAAQAEKQELVGNPRDRHALYYLALALNASGKTPEAIAELERLRAQDPQDPEVLYQLAVYYKQATQQIGREITKVAPDSEWSHALRADGLAESRRYSEAILEYKEVLRKNPNFAGMHFAMGQVYWTEKDSEHAQEELKLALQEDPYQPLANFYLADILVNQKDFQQAIPHLQITLSVYPQMTLAYFLLGKCYAGIGDQQQALETFKKALSQDPNYKEVHFQLSELYARLGDSQKSQAELQIFQKLDKEGRDRDKYLLQENYEKQKESESHK